MCIRDSLKGVHRTVGGVNCRSSGHWTTTYKGSPDNNTLVLTFISWTLKELLMIENSMKPNYQITILVNSVLVNRLIWKVNWH